MADYVTVDFLSETKAKVTIRGRSSSSVYWMIFKPAHVWSESDTSTYVRESHKNFKSVTGDGPITKLAPRINTTGEAEITFPVVAGSAIESICFMDVTNGSDSRFTSWRDLCKRAYTDGAQYLSEADDLYDSIATDYLLFKRPLPPLSTPTGLYADNITSDSATISWNAVEDVPQYQTYYLGAGDVWKPLTLTDTTSVTDTDVTPGWHYSYAVRCVGPRGNVISDYKSSGERIEYIVPTDPTEPVNPE